MSSFENFNDSAEYISRAEDRRAEHRPPRRKLELNKDVPNEQGSFFLNKIRCTQFFCRTPLCPILFCVLHDHKFSFLRY